MHRILPPAQSYVLKNFFPVLISAKGKTFSTCKGKKNFPCSKVQISISGQLCAVNVTPYFVMTILKFCIPLTTGNLVARSIKIYCSRKPLSYGTMLISIRICSLRLCVMEVHNRKYLKCIRSCFEFLKNKSWNWLSTVYIIKTI